MMVILFADVYECISKLLDLKRNPSSNYNEFKSKMNDIDEELKKRNQEVEIPYPYLMPSRIPTSITI